MNLKEYLEALRECPDEELKEEMGVYDNWPIFLKSDSKKLLKDFLESGKYKLKEILNLRPDTQLTRLDFVPGTIRLQLFDWIIRDFATGGGCNRNDKEKEHYQRQLENYNMTILLHPYQKNKMNVPDSRALAIVIDDIGQYITKEEIPICLPHSRGYKYSEDYSRIVYYP
ncbi:MAG: hypothetical protein NTY20_00150 [Candidatus Aenigmarchaeota archaeon]|nr:hypothetical protein [Candidatus Aenigmarchaeota archaeon]